MIAWAHVLAWPVAAIIIAVQARRAIAAAAIAWWSKDIEALDLSGLESVGSMEPVPGFEPDGGGK